MTFSAFDASGSRIGLAPCLDAARQWAEAPEDFLYIAGDIGSGKTHLAVSVARESLDRGGVVYYSTVVDLVDTLRASVADGDGSYYRMMDDLASVELLVLDDLGRERRTSFTSEKVCQVIVGRDASSMPTVVTSALTDDELIRQWPELSSRLLSPYSSIAISLHAPDYRNREAE